MSGEAKLGLLAGIAAVLLIAVVSYRKNQPAFTPPPGTIPAPQSAPVSPPAVSLPQRPPVESFVSDPPSRATVE